MRILSALVVAFLLSTNVVLAQSAQSPNNPDGSAQSEPRPSEESIRHLLDVMQAQKLVQAVSEQMDGMFAGMLKSSSTDRMSRLSSSTPSRNVSRRRRAWSRSC